MIVIYIYSRKGLGSETDWPSTRASFTGAAPTARHAPRQ